MEREARYHYDTSIYGQYAIITDDDVITEPSYP